MPEAPALSLGVFWDSALSLVHLFACQPSLASPPGRCGVGGSSLTTLLLPIPPGSHGDGG